MNIETRKVLFEEELRIHEVNAYNALGFVCYGGTVEETDHGHKNETREATSIELEFWRRSVENTPKILRVRVPDDFDLSEITHIKDLSTFGVSSFIGTAHGNLVWLFGKCSNMNYAALFMKDEPNRTPGWNIVYSTWITFEEDDPRNVPIIPKETNE